MATTKKKTTPKPTWFVKALIKLGVCENAIKYARKHRTFPAAWNSCAETDWMGWLLIRLKFNLAHSAWCADCSGQDKAKLSGRLRRRFTAERVAKALRKATNL